MSEKQAISRPNRIAYKKLLREEAEERQAKHDALSVMEKIAKLDKIFGPNAGAKKERAKLKSMLEKQEDQAAKSKAVKKVEKETAAQKKNKKTAKKRGPKESS